MPKQTQAQQNQAPQRGSRNGVVAILSVVIVVLVAANMLMWQQLRQASAGGGPLSILAQPATTPSDAGLRDFKVVNAHEHLFSRKYLDKYLRAAESTGVVRTLFVASSDFTLKGKGYEATKGNEANTLEILHVARQHPGKIIPFCTLHPGDPDPVGKLRRYVEEGAMGLKLYTGHGNFYDRPLDCEEMLPVYAYCQETNLPICWHVNFLRYAGEFERVMRQFPNMTVIVPHWGVTFWRPRGPEYQRFLKMLDTYPNLYTDTSFGTREILVGGLEIVSRERDLFRAFFEKYADRTLWGTDMVVTGNREKTEEWVEAVLRACRDVLEKDTYHFFMGAKGSRHADKKANNIYGVYRGLALSDDILRKVYETNIDKLFPPEKI
ncbi:MAG: amidohydrolase family protein [Nitrospiraceae bacterium]|nr:amidohydrolase family protein [Nitrospiraceae bacterium]